MKRRGILIPVIFITARRDEAQRAELIREEAVNCLFKPFSDTALLDALRSAPRASCIFPETRWRRK